MAGSVRVRMARAMAWSIVALGSGPGSRLALAQETPPPGAQPGAFLAGWWILLLIAVACLAFGGWVWWSYRGRR